MTFNFTKLNRLVLEQNEWELPGSSERKIPLEVVILISHVLGLGFSSCTSFLLKHRHNQVILQKKCSGYFLSELSLNESSDSSRKQTLKFEQTLDIRLYFVTNTVNLRHKWDSFSNTSNICLAEKRALEIGEWFNFLALQPSSSEGKEPNLWWK